jgi:hypothetical protein
MRGHLARCQNMLVDMRDSRGNSGLLERISLFKRLLLLATFAVAICHWSISIRPSRRLSRAVQFVGKSTPAIKGVFLWVCTVSVQNVGRQRLEIYSIDHFS